MNGGVTYGMAAARKLCPEPEQPTWQLQLGMAATGPVDLATWECTIVYQPGVLLHGGGGCTITGDSTGIYTVIPDNTTITAGGRAIVAVRVHDTPSAPLGVQFLARTTGGMPILVRCDTIAVRHADGTTHPATETTWPRSTTMQRGHTALTPWGDWLPPFPRRTTVRFEPGNHVPAQRTSEAIRRMLRRTRGGGLGLCRGARHGL